MYFKWRDTENQQLNRLPNIRVCMTEKTIILLIIIIIIIIIIVIIIALSLFFNGLSSNNLHYRGHEKKNEKKKKIHTHTVYIKHNAKVGGVVSKFLFNRNNGLFPILWKVILRNNAKACYNSRFLHTV